MKVLSSTESHLVCLGQCIAVGIQSVYCIIITQVSALISCLICDHFHEDIAVHNEIFPLKLKTVFCQT